MRNVYEVLKEKELQLERLKQEVDDLRLAAEILAHGYESQKLPPQSVTIDQETHAVPSRFEKTG
jgi:hypothetical protein